MIIAMGQKVRFSGIILLLCLFFWELSKKLYRKKYIFSGMVFVKQKNFIFYAVVA